ncbi:hypothetical protein OXX80_001827 [Metschnikowia pulcherrima]
MSNQSTGNGNKSNSADFETPTLSENVLEYTPTKEIPNLVNHLKTSFRKDRKTHSLTIPSKPVAQHLFCPPGQYR